ncbi:hypothetical protein OCOJLMKI_5162 [Methylobacterium iners]|uniref:Uncharacterized protein n=1 Tax=Methylobacterium iners TaxID=418707 RepID=A0ABQ4S7Z8_9HYPH|nr:hypothetical protein OCOJLMKI_5162 [Methylobacterium iners]
MMFRPIARTACMVSPGGTGADVQVFVVLAAGLRTRSSGVRPAAAHQSRTLILPLTQSARQRLTDISTAVSPADTCCPGLFFALRSGHQIVGPEVDPPTRCSGQALLSSPPCATAAGPPTFQPTPLAPLGAIFALAVARPALQLWLSRSRLAELLLLSSRYGPAWFFPPISISRANRNFPQPARLTPRRAFSCGGPRRPGSTCMMIKRSAA